MVGYINDWINKWFKGFFKLNIYSKLWIQRKKSNP